MLEKLDKEVIKYLDEIAKEIDSIIDVGFTHYDESTLQIYRRTIFFELGEQLFERMKDYKKDLKNKFGIEAKLIEEVHYNRAVREYGIRLRADFDK